MAMNHSFRMFAIKAHGDQRYGDFPYPVHLAHVEHILEQFGFGNDMWRATAWLHDVYEDTSTEAEMPALRKTVQQLFGDEVDQIAWACSGFGPNRAARNLCIKEKILVLPKAAITKCADRLANVEFSSNTRKSGMIGKYKKELPEFETYIRPHVPENMWARLERSCFDRD
jgi:(p)ppGpp synthase/HD superfamily hydrolase